MHTLGLTQDPRVVGDRVEDGLNVARGFAHDLQDIRGRRLPVEGFLCLLEEADVLDGDRGLVRKCAQQIDLLLGERLDLGAP